MAFDFPASPTEGQIYTPAGGPSYVYAGGVWKLLSTPASYPTAQTRNRIVNPAMQISQENGDNAGAVTLYYPADQWFASFTVASGAISIARVPGGTLAGANRFISMSSAGGVTIGAANTVSWRQYIEGLQVADLFWGTAYAKPAVLRFWAYANVAGTYSIRVANMPGPVTRSFVAQFTLAASTWKEIVIPIPGDTSGTWLTDSSASLLLDFVAAAGSTYVGVTGWQAGNFYAAAGQANALTAGGNFNITNVSLYLDPDNTGKAPSWEMPDYASELQACQRYWEKTGSIRPLWNGNCTTGIAYSAGAAWMVEKRAAPTLSGVNGYNSGFPATVGTLTNTGLKEFYETRTSNATANGGQFNSIITGNARM